MADERGAEGLGCVFGDVDDGTSPTDPDPEPNAVEDVHPPQFETVKHSTILDSRRQRRG
jgi:hypothetical protein